MNKLVTKAAALIQPAEDDAETKYGSFDVILSAQSLDRDGDILKSDEWKTPLPDHIVFDTDHGMSVATTVGSGRPFINENGDLQVKGTYSSIPRAQEVRTLVNEGHIRTTSVAFMTERSEQKDAKPVRELLNGAFVAIPSNRDAVVLSSKSLEVEAELKLGARNNANDATHIQAAHDHMVMLGANCAGPEDSSGSEEGAEGGKSVGAAETPEAEASDVTQKDAADNVAATDAALDEAIKLIKTIDTEGLPPEVLQAFALIQAADSAVDNAMSDMGIPDPDEDTTDESASDASEEDASDADESAAVVARALSLAIECEALSY